MDFIDFCTLVAVSDLVLCVYVGVSGSFCPHMQYFTLQYCATLHIFIILL